MTAPVKEFVMRHDFKDVPNFKENVNQYSPTEEHFNIPWGENIEDFSVFILNFFVKRQSEIIK